MSDLRLSHSQVETYSGCGERYRLERIAKVPRVPGWSMVGGSAVHTATENLDRQDFGMPIDGPLDFASAFELQIEKQKEMSPLFPESTWHCAGRVSKENPNKEDYKWWVANGQTFVNNWRRWLRDGPWSVWITPDGDPAIELALEGTVGGVAWLGYLDRVMEHRDGDLAVVDLKTGSRDPSGDSQLGTYGLKVKEGWGVLPRWGFYFMNRKGQTTVPVELAKFEDGRLDYEYTQVAAAIRAEIFIPTKSMLCPSCGVRDACWKVDGVSAAQYAPYKKEGVLSTDVASVL